MEQLLAYLSWAVYLLFVFLSFFKKGPIGKMLVKSGSEYGEYENFFARILMGIIFIPILGVILNALGYVGKFLLVPFKFLQF
ncbi:MAG: hypothetical protein WC849_02795 [Candidatus Paceibacterota bacterium]